MRRLLKKSGKSPEIISKGACNGVIWDSETSEDMHKLERLLKKKDPDAGKAARQAEFLKVFSGNLFNLSAAARTVGISRSSVYGWKTEPDFKQRFENVMEERKDWLQSKLFEKVEQGDVACTIFCAKCLLSDRGFLPDKLLELHVTNNEKKPIRLLKADRDEIVDAALRTHKLDLDNLPRSKPH